MRVAFFSPMPPARSGIADYSATLVEQLRNRLEIEVFDRAPRSFNPAAYDACLYQLGNNAHHAFVYEMAVRHPGIVVLHEGSLHHLIAEMTIGRGDWDAYLREAEYEGGAAALARARRARSLEAGPDYEGLAMTRRVLESARAVIVHSCYMVDQVRARGFAGPVARIPHGGWIVDGNRMAYRERLGLDESVPLAGIFGFLKPYKRIAESLRAFRRLIRVEPRARLILVGEPHPDLPIRSMLRTLGLSEHVRLLGFTPIQEFTGYMSACDILLNLRYPTVGESSGSLMRALGLGRAVIVSDVGSFLDLPDDACLKAPVDAAEEDHLFEYLSLLVSRPEIARALGARARKYVETECRWEIVADRYAAFLEKGTDAFSAVGEKGTDAFSAVVAENGSVPFSSTPPPTEPPQPADILGWAPPEPLYRAYVDQHATRLTRTLEITPPGTANDSVLEMGAYLQITPLLRTRLGYGEVRTCYYGPAGTVDRRTITSTDGGTFECDIELFNAEKDRFPYPDAYFATVLCCELIEHLPSDPMFLMSEVNRVLRPGGHLVLTTPNIASLRAISGILQGYHPGFFPAYILPNFSESDPRHAREYAPREVQQLMWDAGFDVTLLETGPFRDQPHPEHAWVKRLLERYRLPSDLRGDDIFAVGRKIGPIRSRYPEWLYSGHG